MGRLSRRRFLQISSAGAVALVLPWTLEGCAEEEEQVRFFTSGERATIDAATARILPPDGGPDARAVGAADYIERLLTAFDHDPPLIYAGGPFSGRLPYPDGRTGRPSNDFPANSFRRFLPLSRVKEIAWRVRLFGSANVPGGAFNDAVLGPTQGLRDVYRQGLRDLDATSRERFGRAFAALTPEQQDEALAAGERSFVQQLVEHLLEAAFAAPEYGGNRDLAGWRALAYDGESQPLGYSLFNESTGEYEELPDKPISSPNPDEDFAGLNDETVAFIGGVVAGVGGTRFF